VIENRKTPDVLEETSESVSHKAPRYQCLLMWLVLLLSIYLTLQQLIWVNVNPSEVDQSAFILLSKESADPLPHRNRMPLTPFLLKILRFGFGEEHLFFWGKATNLFLMLVLYGALLWRLKDLLMPAWLLSFFILTLPTILALRGPYLHAEPLFMMFTLWSVHLLTCSSDPPKTVRSLCLGVVWALGYLTKASMLFWIVMSLLSLMIYFRKKAILSVLVSTVTFFLITSPYCQNSYQHYGKWFYNINTSHYVWMESWSYVQKYNRERGNIHAHQAQKKEGLPNMGKYFQENHFSEIVTRFYHGAKRVIRGWRQDPSFLSCMFSFSCIMGAVMILLIRRGEPLRFPVFWFVPGMLLLQFLLVSFYIPIGRGNRFWVANLPVCLLLLIQWGQLHGVTLGRKWFLALLILVLVSLQGFILGSSHSLNTIMGI
jgi:hypothetical protein